MSFHRRLVQARQRQAVPAQLILVALESSVSLKIDDVPGSIFLEGQVDELVLQAHHGLAAVDDVVGHGLGHAAGLGLEGVVDLDHPLAVQALVAHRPGDDLAHALHLVVAREVHQHREAGE